MIGEHTMAKIRLRYVVEDVDRNGNVRCYARLPGRPKVRLLGIPGSEEFMKAYHAAIAAKESVPSRTRGAARGSFRHVCQAYYSSASFKALDAKTQNWRRRALEAVCEKHAGKPVALMQPKHVRALRDERADAKGAAKYSIESPACPIPLGGRGRRSAARSDS
jgi:hypothetical protein